METKQRFSSVATVAGWLRDLWVALGVALLLFLLLEGLYVGQRAIRAVVFGSDAERAAQVEGHPYRGQAWYRQLIRERERQRKKWDAWRIYWSYPLAGRYVNVDSAGRRVTIQPPANPAPSARVFMLGGSAMWGYAARDSATIPSLVAHRLAALGVSGVEIVNLAQPGYVMGQELATLEVEWARANVPTMAVFFNGINDIRAALLSSEPGHVFFESRLRRLYEVDANRGVVGALAAAAQHSAFINRLVLALGLSREWVEPTPPPDLCPRVSDYYRRLSDAAMRLSQRGQFDLLLVLQPMHATTMKPLSAFERSLRGNPDRMRTIGACARAIESAMAADSGRTFLSLSSVFDDRPETVFLDGYGHVTETGNRLVADRLAQAIAQRLWARTAGLP
ncbi:MAG: SGNH/GDSL hydrolase family protein [Gemmatimonadota bacterium]